MTKLTIETKLKEQITSLNIYDYLKKIQQYLLKTSTESLQLSLDNVHADGLFSLVIHNTEFGKLTRVFIASKEIKNFDVQIHTHRYPIILTPITGYINNIEAYIQCVGYNYSHYEYKSPLNNGNGLEYKGDVTAQVSITPLAIGSQLFMSTDEYHTVSCSAGSIWVVEELGFEKDHSMVLGSPFITDELYTKPIMFAVNDKHQQVEKHLNLLIKGYEAL